MAFVSQKKHHKLRQALLKPNIHLQVYISDTELRWTFSIKPSLLTATLLDKKDSCCLLVFLSAVSTHCRCAAYSDSIFLKKYRKNKKPIHWCQPSKLVWRGVLVLGRTSGGEGNCPVDGWGSIPRLYRLIARPLLFSVPRKASSAWSPSVNSTCKAETTSLVILSWSSKMSLFFTIVALRPAMLGITLRSTETIS